METCLTEEGSEAAIATTSLRDFRRRLKDKCRPMEEGGGNVEDLRRRYWLRILVAALLDFRLLHKAAAKTAAQEECTVPGGGVGN